MTAATQHAAAGTRLTGERPVSATALAARLRHDVRGDVLFDDGSRAQYSTDASNYRQLPMGVVLPLDADDVRVTVAACRHFGAPIVMRGGGTSLAGQTCNEGVVIDISRHLNRILEIDPERRVARVQPGVVLDDLRDAAEHHGLTFGPDPATHDHCTLGGMIGNNSCGVHSVMAGKTIHNVEELVVLTYDGEVLRVGPTDDGELNRLAAGDGRPADIYRRLRDLRERYADQLRTEFPELPRRVSGYSLDQLLPEKGCNVARSLVGTEGTCVIVLEATLRLVPSPPARSLLVLGYPDVFVAGDDVTAIMAAGPTGLEGLDEQLVEYARRANLHPDAIGLLPEGGAWLLVEFGADDRQASDRQAQELMDELSRRSNPPSMKLFDDPEGEEKIWIVRESGLAATAWVPGMPDAWPGWEDSAVPPKRLGDYLRELRALMERYGYEAALYGHFGQGCVHCRITFDLLTRPGIEEWRSFMGEAADLVVRYGGSLSGEHGDGQARAELLPKMFSPALLEAFGEFKAIWDPDGLMNPGKVVDPNPLDSHLRFGSDYQPIAVQTHFSFATDNGSFARAAMRCVGVGKCRKEHDGVMCPSYMVTREDEHSTRGRARRLFEMMRGDFLTDGWQSEEVKDALDLCLACKGCKGECPVDVDMATYKAEFLSHYYDGHRRPRSAYAFGLIMYWARAAALVPDLVNVLGRTPGLARLGKLATGMAPERHIPRFARRTFRDWFQGRRAPAGAREVILWADTFNNHFHPSTARAAAEFLEANGFRVTVPRRQLCCGRPLYDYGMLDTASRFLGQILDELRPQIRAGVPVVGLEPSCVSVFRDELPNLRPNDPDAERLARQTRLLSEFLADEGIAPPQMAGRALLHGHCHDRSVLTGQDHEADLLRAMGLEVEVLDSGCCGMAGSFGFEAGEHYDVSVKAGERVLLPRTREAAPETLIVADGYSCREQIAQQTDRQALHVADVLRLALDGAGAQPYPEQAYLREAQRAIGGSVLPSLAAGAALAAMAGLGLRAAVSRLSR